MKRQPIEIIIKLLLAAKKKENEDAAWDVWLMQFLASKICGDKIKTFEEYLQTIENPQIGTDEEYDDIIKSAEKAKKRHQESLKKVK